MEKCCQSKAIVPMITFAVLGFIFVYPRILFKFLHHADPWMSYLYQYGLGSVTFLIGLFLVMRTGSLRLNRGHDRLWFIWLIIGFFVFALGHAAWIWFALNTPIKS